MVAVQLVVLQEQVAAVQVVVAPTFAQAPCPAVVPAVHEPVLVRQTFVALGVVGQRASAPLVTAMQVPRLPVTLQAWQAPLHALVQQTPSTQVSPAPQGGFVAAPQAAPAPLGRTQAPATQVRPATQSVLTVQFVRQTVPLQVNVPHWVVAPAVQVPVALQVLAAVAEQAVFPVAQVQTAASPHAVPAGLLVPSTQAGAPFAHEIMPFLHAAPVLVVQAMPVTHATHICVLLQTMPVPHAVPTVAFGYVHTPAPATVAQVAPVVVWQVGGVVQVTGAPITQVPALHMFTPSQALVSPAPQPACGPFARLG